MSKKSKGSWNDIQSPIYKYRSNPHLPAYRLILDAHAVEYRALSGYSRTAKDARKEILDTIQTKMKNQRLRLVEKDGDKWVPFDNAKARSTIGDAVRSRHDALMRDATSNPTGQLTIAEYITKWNLVNDLYQKGIRDTNEIADKLKYPRSDFKKWMNTGEMVKNRLGDSGWGNGVHPFDRKLSPSYRFTLNEICKRIEKFRDEDGKIYIPIWSSKKRLWWQKKGAIKAELLDLIHDIERVKNTDGTSPEYIKAVKDHLIAVGLIWENDIEFKKYKEEVAKVANTDTTALNFQYAFWITAGETPPDKFCPYHPISKYIKELEKCMETDKAKAITGALEPLIEYQRNAVMHVMNNITEYEELAYQKHQNKPYKDMVISKGGCATDGCKWKSHLVQELNHIMEKLSGQSDKEKDPYRMTAAELKNEEEKLVSQCSEHHRVITLVYQKQRRHQDRLRLSSSRIRIHIAIVRALKIHFSKKCAISGNEITEDNVLCTDGHHVADLCNVIIGEDTVLTKKLSELSKIAHYSPDQATFKSRLYTEWPKLAIIFANYHKLVTHVIKHVPDEAVRKPYTVQYETRDGKKVRVAYVLAAPQARAPLPLVAIPPPASQAAVAAKKVEKLTASQQANASQDSSVAVAKLGESMNDMSLEKSDQSMAELGGSGTGLSVSSTFDVNMRSTSVIIEEMEMEESHGSEQEREYFGGPHVWQPSQATDEESADVH